MLKTNSFVKYHRRSVEMDRAGFKLNQVYMVKQGYDHMKYIQGTGNEMIVLINGSNEYTDHSNYVKEHRCPIELAVGK